jgi:hypothetical protein
MASKWKLNEKALMGGLVVIAVLSLGSLIATAINCATSVEISREAPARVAYSYCAQWQSAYKSQTCVRYATGHETRIVKHMRGGMWDYDTYEVAR